MGIWGAAIGVFFAILLLWGYEYKWKLILILIGFVGGILLSYSQYGYWDKKYNSFKDFAEKHQSRK